MLLHRVTEHVREQNWTAIAIDFVIVVLGVFVGIQVSNWNAEREARHRGTEFAERLRADLSEERRMHQFMVAYYSVVRDAANSAVAALDGMVPLSHHDLLVNAYRATQYRQGARRRSTYDELVSTGSLGLIADQRLLRLASQLYRLETIENLVRESLQSSYRQSFRMSITNDVQRELKRSCGDRITRAFEFKGKDMVLGYTCKLELPSETIDAAANTLRSDPNLVRTLRLRSADLETRLGDLSGSNRDLFEELPNVIGAAQPE